MGGVSFRRNKQAPPVVRGCFLLLSRGDIVVAGAPIGTGSGIGGQETGQLVLVQIHVTDIIVIVLVIDVPHAGLTLVHHTSSTSRWLSNLQKR